MSDVRVSSRVNKGKRGRVLQQRILADVPLTSIPTLGCPAIVDHESAVVSHSSPGPSPISKKKNKGTRVQRVVKKLNVNFVVPAIATESIDVQGQI
jgi:hypothetical protein